MDLSTQQFRTEPAAKGGGFHCGSAERGRLPFAEAHRLCDGTQCWADMAGRRRVEGFVAKMDGPRRPSLRTALVRGCWGESICVVVLYLIPVQLAGNGTLAAFQAGRCRNGTGQSVLFLYIYQRSLRLKADETLVYAHTGTHSPMRSAPTPPARPAAAVPLDVVDRMVALCTGLEAGPRRAPAWMDGHDARTHRAQSRPGCGKPAHMTTSACRYVEYMYEISQRHSQVTSGPPARTTRAPTNTTHRHTDGSHVVGHHRARMSGQF